MHMVILPLIPIFILIVQNGFRYGTYVFQAYEMERVIDQVNQQVLGQGAYSGSGRSSGRSSLALK